jgi:hypothetical protein
LIKSRLSNDLFLFDVYTAFIENKMKNEKYHTVGTVPNSNSKFVERGKFDTSNTHIHDRTLSCLGTGTSVKGGEVNALK